MRILILMCGLLIGGSGWAQNDEQILKLLQGSNWLKADGLLNAEFGSQGIYNGENNKKLDQFVTRQSIASLRSLGSEALYTLLRRTSFAALNQVQSKFESQVTELEMTGENQEFAKSYTRARLKRTAEFIKSEGSVGVGLARWPALYIFGGVLGAVSEITYTTRGGHPLGGAGAAIGFVLGGWVDAIAGSVEQNARLRSAQRSLKVTMDFATKFGRHDVIYDAVAELDRSFELQSIYEKSKGKTRERVGALMQLVKEVQLAGCSR